MTDDRRGDRRPVGGSAPPSPGPAAPPRPAQRNLPPGWTAAPPGPPPGPNGRRPDAPPPRGPQGAPPPAPTRTTGRHGSESPPPAVGNGPEGTRVGGPFPDPRRPGGEQRPEPRLLTHDASRPLVTAATAAPTRANAATRTGARPGTAPTAATEVVQGTAAPGRSGTRTPPPGTPPRGTDGDDDQPDPKRRKRRIRRVIYVLVGLLVLGPILAFAIGWIFFRIPSPDDATNNQVATISYADGSSMASLTQAEGNRIKVPLSQVPLPVQHAVASAEDRSFYTNYGFDPIGIARAAWNQAQGGVGGGSTITQQYVKNVLVGDEYSYWRKYREVVIAAKINQEQSKEQILENYLNTIYFGRGAYGIQAASQAYFGRDVATLNPSEGAMLAGLIQAPSKWDPAVDRGGSEQRWNYVLDGMVAQNWLARADRQAAVFPTTIPPSQRRSGIPDNDRGHIVSAVKDELASYGITEQQVNQEGLKVETTVDPKLQQQAADAAVKTLQGQPANLRTSLVSVEPETGAIKAYYGGKDGSGFDYAQARRQPGSSFKPFVLLAGLEQNPPIGLGKTYDGSSPREIAGTKIANSEGESCANCDLKTAMTLSINTVFYQLGVDVGPQKVADAAHQAGVSAPLEGATGGISIGDKEVRPGDMASAYATFAADGQYHRPHMVTRVTTADGRILYDGGVPAVEQRMSQQLARNVTESMLDVASHSQIGLSGGRPVATKTGTVQSSQEGQNNDAWTVGYTPQMSTAVWVGTDDNSPIKTSNGKPIYGRGVPGQIWQRFMNQALRSEPVEQFSDFKAIGTPPAPPAPATPTPDPNNPDGQNNGQYCVDGVCVNYGDGQNGNNGDNGNGQNNGNNGQNGDGQNNGQNGNNNGDNGGNGNQPDNGGDGGGFGDIFGDRGGGG
ncbi:transglycosylase domain-containing protein [Actinomycetospora termitidis]|uniref:Transglycosylase domain-containing protein n=1 Tax=Actinomycetospora termitidis TaxID=3053470 RepID=A0ABT7M2I9_9PSEU|nr:transglycosylase domain-containing protein [Actinomycetospora sp. Odt1-22]MDL5154882.1 transglycosylase domain-containing protein [Actinomycetospora sp. Odt1-22]